jgi:hypothetical protein
MAAACSMSREKVIRPLGFSRRGEYIGERAASEGGPAGLTPWWRGPEVGRARDLVTGREIWLPTGNRVSRAPTVSIVTEQKIPNLFEIFEF